jgi:hypothetical protein
MEEKKEEAAVEVASAPPKKRRGRPPKAARQAAESKASKPADDSAAEQISSIFDLSSVTATPARSAASMSAPEFVQSYLDAHPDITSRTHWTDARVAPIAIAIAIVRINVDSLQFVDRTAEDARPCKGHGFAPPSRKDLHTSLLREGIEPSTSQKAFFTDTFFVTFSAPEGIEHTSQRLKSERTTR